MIRKFTTILCAALLSVLFCQGAAADVRVTAPRAEMLDNPLGIDTAAPRLGWRIESDVRNVMQTGYRILAASSEEILAADEGDLWDTGRVDSDQSQWIPYGGRKLRSNDRVYWKVKAYTTAEVHLPDGRVELVGSGKYSYSILR